MIQELRLVRHYIGMLIANKRAMKAVHKNFDKFWTYSMDFEHHAEKIIDILEQQDIRVGIKEREKLNRIKAMHKVLYDINYDIPRS